MQKYIPSIPQDSFSDPRARLTIADGADFVRLAKKKGKKYDLVIIDSPDPVGPAKSLFRTSFYLDVSSVLSPDGIVIRQTGSSILQSDEMPANFRQMEAVFAEVQGLATSVPTYIGGYFTFVAASHKKGIFREALKSLDSRFKRGFSETVKNSLDWYSPETHRAAMALPAEVKRAIDKSEYGIHLVMDLAECDYSVLGSREKLKEFVEELCRVIGMRPYGATLLPDFGHGMAKTAGLSLFQFIETSGIMGHFSPHWREAYLDIFTCKSFDPKVTLEFVKKFFSAGRVVSYLIKRGPRALKDKPELTLIE
jgi:S-adenosylmethionine/arginine decarboxylase-like enzyme